MSPSGKAPDFDSGIRRFESFHPCQIKEYEAATQWLLNHAIKIATHAHDGQVDKQGVPYIEHPRRVMEAADTLEKKIVAILHDTVEDTYLSLCFIYADFDKDIGDAIDAITHRKNEPNVEYYARIMTNPLAHAVKLLDIADNQSRLSTLDEDTKMRLTKKYEKALSILAKV